MSLVVAAIHDDDQITMVADTKISFFGRDGQADEARTRRTYFEALPKIVLLRPDLIVGVTGDDPDAVIERVAALRSSSVAQVLDSLGNEPEADFVVAELSPAALWQVVDGTVEERTSGKRAWAGSLDAYNIFQARFHDTEHGDDGPFRLLSSMQALTSFDPVKSVGGIALLATSTNEGFFFVGGASMIGPHFLQIESVRVEGTNVTVRAAVPPGVDPTMYQTFVLPGVEPTRGAVAFLIPQTGRGVLFRESRPWEGVWIPATTTTELAAVALADHGEAITATESPPGFQMPAL